MNPDISLNRMPSARKHRDLTFVDISPREMLIISCDSCGAIGSKEKDIVKVKPETVGYYTAQVALMELLAVGAKPRTLVNNLSVEMHPTGEQILKGIKKALFPLSLKDIPIITGSTEENFPVCQTAMGVTVIGVVDKMNWQLPRAQRGDIAAVVGIPKVGEEVLWDFGQETLSLETLLMLQKTDVNEIIPVGSKGILYEANQMAKTNNLSFSLINNVTLDIYKSAGPSTCGIVALKKEETLEILNQKIPIPINVIGKFL